MSTGDSASDLALPQGGGMCYASTYVVHNRISAGPLKQNETSKAKMSARAIASFSCQKML